MRLNHSIISVAAILAICTAPAHAGVNGGLGGSSGSFVDLSALGLDGGSIATLSGGMVYSADEPYADIPKGDLHGGTFLAAGPVAGSPATLTFTGAGVGFVSFLWGSPDDYNQLTVNGSGGYSQTFTTTELGLPGNGDQSISRYVSFAGTDGTLITSLTFDNQPKIDAFESANFSITPVPEPSTCALLLAGLGALGWMSGRQRRRAAPLNAAR